MLAETELETLLAPCAKHPPCGEDLEYDAEFLELFRQAQEQTAERMVGSAQEQSVDFRKVLRSCVDLFTRTKDLRVASLLCQAALQVESLTGFCTGVDLLASLVERHWEPVHPVLTEEELLNPMMRANAVHELRSRSVLLLLQNTALVDAPGLGSVSYKELVSTADDDGAELARINAVFMACDRERLRDLCGVLARTRQRILDLQIAFNRAIDGAFPGVDLEPVEELLGRMDRAVSPRLATREGQAATNVVEADQADAASTAGPKHIAGGAAGQGLGGEVRSRDEVVAALDAVCAYYQRAEPASPVPMLLRRALRLVPMSFEEVLGDLAPSAMGEVQVFRGPSG